MRTHLTLGMFLFALPLVAGCYGSTSAGDDDADHGTTDDGTADVPVDAADTDADADADADADVPPPECVVDDDCVVALNEERCCSPDPLAVPRSQLAADHCLHELGVPWTATHDDCWRECYACGPIAERYYAARCDAGRCVGISDFCAPMVAPPSAGIFDATVVPRGGWESYRGQLLTVHGWPYLGPHSATCTPESDDCFSTPVQQTLACNLTLRGSVCGTPWSCSGTECDAACTPDPIYGELWLDGYVVDTEAAGLEFWPVSSHEECAPAGPNPEGAACTPGVDGECADGMYCHYWGDVLFPCAGECRHEGTECVVEGDCAAGETCYHGWCEWCCPG